MKQCRTCKRTLPETEFNRKTKYRDGLDTWCRECAIAYQRNNVYKWESSTGIKVRQQSAPNAASEQARRERKRRNGKQYHETHAARDRAGCAVNYAVRTGKLARVNTLKCEECGEPAHVYHHADYNKPLDVTPMCRSCHKLWHANNKPIEAD